MHKDASARVQTLGNASFLRQQWAVRHLAWVQQQLQNLEASTEQVLHRLVHGVNHVGVGSSHLGLGR